MNKVESPTHADPAKVLALLWRKSSAAAARPGPRPRLNIEEIIVTSIALADARGLDGLTIRAVAEQLNCSAMSIYTYIPGKAELLCVMHDQVLGELAEVERAGDDWRSTLSEIARDNFELALRHPWILSMSLARPPLGPNLIAKYDEELQAVEHLPLSDVQKDAALTLVIDIAHSAARAQLQRTVGERESGISDSEWWAASQPFLARMLDDSRFPLASRIGAAAGAEHQSAHSPLHALEFGLERALDGVAALIKA